MIICCRVFIILLFVGKVCFSDKIYFSKWIEPKIYLDWNIFQFGLVVGKDVDYCIESCKAKKRCEYINFNVKMGVCSLIAIENVSALIIFDRSNVIVEQKKGYIFGQKHDWNMDEYEACKDCQPYGVCKEGIANQQYSMCQSSGCVVPEDKENAIINGNLYSIGDKIEYKCQIGHTDVFDGTRISTCHNNGVWTPVNTKCIRGQLDPKFLNNSVYLLDKTWRIWNDGKLYCESIGGKLIDMKTPEKNEFVINKVVVKNNGLGAWVGANYFTNSWRWLDGTLVSDGFTNWGMAQPYDYGEKCMLIYNDLMWHDAQCSLYAWSLCEIRMR